MARTTTTRKQHLKVSSTQMEMDTNDRNWQVDAKQKIAELEQEKQRVEQERIQLEETTKKKHDCISGRSYMIEQLGNAITNIERNLKTLREDTEHLEQARICFAEHLNKIDKISPESWRTENVPTELNLAISILDHAEEEYEEAIDYFATTEHGNIFGGKTSSKKKTSSAKASSDFVTTVKEGLAFNFPLVVLGLIALIMYWVK